MENIGRAGHSAELLRSRKPFTPTVGETYRNNGGGVYRCTRISSYTDTPTMVNVASGWTLEAHGLGRYADGSIDWDYSTGGHFAPEYERAGASA